MIVMPLLILELEALVSELALHFLGGMLAVDGSPFPWGAFVPSFPSSFVSLMLLRPRCTVLLLFPMLLHFLAVLAAKIEFRIFHW